VLRRFPQLRLVGLGFHIGSQILDVQPFLDSFLRLKQVAADFKGEGFPVEHLDVGGGVGIPYKDEPPADLGRYARFLQEQHDGYRILFEPGRAIVGNAGVLLSQVLYHKINHGKQFVVVDGAMNDLIRPSLYQSYHEMCVLQQQEGEITADVVGPVCETGDFFARDRKLPPVKQGHYLAIMNAGAYGFPLSSNYNSRPRVAEVLIDEDRITIIRQRETFEDLTRGEEVL
jgi:diaminopimelate decarboxylase